VYIFHLEFLILLPLIAGLAGNDRGNDKNNSGNGVDVVFDGIDGKWSPRR
jgi:hypothetical protein